MKIGILQTGHSPEDLFGPFGDYDGMFRDMLDGNGFEFQTWAVVDGVLPDGADEADAWLITGSKHGAYEDHAWIPPLEELIREINARKQPLAGICFGHQIIAQALGGKVEKYPGGWAIGRYGLRRLIWPFVLAQNLLNLLYVWLVSQADPLWWATPWASGHPGFPPLAGISTLTATAVITAEHFGEGLGTAVFVVYILRCCNPRFKAAHMAIVTALMSVGVTIMGVSSGVLVEQLGFGRYFGFSFAACVPMMLLIFAIPHLDGRPDDDDEPVEKPEQPPPDVPKTDEA